MRCRLAALGMVLILVGLGPSTFAQTTVAASAPSLRELPPVEIRGNLKDRAEKPYAELFKALTVFNDYQKKHPDAQLRFRLYARRKEADLSRLKLKLVGTTQSVAIDLAPDLSFTLPWLPELAQQNALLQGNVAADDLGWRAQVTRRGAPPEKMWLGDLRLACKLHFLTTNLARTGGPGVLPGSDKPSFCGQGVTDTFTERSVLALRLSQAEGVAHTIADQAMFAVHLTHGRRRMSLLSSRLTGNALPEAVHHLLDWPAFPERVYFPPIADTRWPDNTQVELEYMATDSPLATPLPVRWADVLQLGRSMRTDVERVLGKATLQRFPNGFEVWTYRQIQGLPRAANLVPFLGVLMPDVDDRSVEQAFLFSADGVLRKVDLRGVAMDTEAPQASVASRP